MSSKPITKEYLAKQLKNFQSQVLVQNFVTHEESKDVVEKSHEHTNYDILDKISESEEGNLLFNGEGLSADIKLSEDEGNAIQKQENGGLIVADKTEQIERIESKLDPIARYQKYVNTELD